MFGDSFGPGGDLTITDLLGPGPVDWATDVPLAAACRRVKVAENNKPLPQDRIYLLYNHFHNALVFDRLANVAARDFSVDRYTFGFEKTFLDDLWSVELRMPFASDMDAAVPQFSVDGGSVGNLAVILKGLVYETDITSVAVGLGIDTPTGSDVRGLTPAPLADYTFRNQAVHLMPFIGFMQAPNDIWFCEGFLQVDIPANGNPFELSAPGPGTLGILNEQTLLYLDLSLGCWLYRNTCAPYLTGVASVVELHYTSTLQDTDIVAATAAGIAIDLRNSADRQDVLNLTVGLHAEVARHTLLRVGGVVPLRRGDDRFFDAEIQVQLERRF
jgi:hypothetical protein